VFNKQYSIQQNKVTKMKHFSLFFALICSWAMLHATTVEVSGTVRFGAQEEVVPGYPVVGTFISSVGVEITTEVVTDEQGNYLLSEDLGDIDGDIVVIVSTFDLCTGVELAEEFTLTPDDASQGNIDFVICSDIIPPPPPEGCDAFFTWEQQESDPYIVQFYDLSYIDNDAGTVSWFWDFGDGSTSTEQEPTHTYDQAGDYDVVFTVSTDSCTSVSVHPVHVQDFDFCNCDWVYEPICVLLPDGDIIPFINECEAICAGFDDFELVDCENDGPCGCPDLFFPVCVQSPDGDTLNFDNPCLAECEGFGEDTFIDCPGDAPCGCDFDFVPVCVTTDEGIIEFFPNACFAECAGYTEDQYSLCDGFGCFAAFEYEVLDNEELSVDFFDISSSIGAPPVSWNWDLGDGTTSSEPSFVHVYPEPGNYQVTLKIETEDGCESVYTQNICVGEDCVGDCDCPDIFDPVCVITPDGEIITLPNECFAVCIGLTQFVDCGDCACDDILDPVCVVTDWGEIDWFPNPCEAECAGYGPDTFVDCDDDCICPTYIDPVCVVGEEGDTLQFQNPCFAECEGYGPDQYFYCDYIDPCDCYEIFDPVCILTAEGEFLIFPNDCYAICEGYSEEDFIDCGSGEYDNCSADFYYEIGDGGEVFFIDNSSTWEGEVVSWEWNFGDGNSSDEQNPTHQYTEDGIFDVILTITTSEGCVSTTIQHLCIGDGGVFEGPDCQAMFFFEQSTDVPFTFQFTDFSFGEADSWSWNFGDGNTSMEQNPVHSYAEEGVYLVQLTITSGDCQSSMAMILFTDEDIWYPNECMALFLPIIIPETNQVFFLNLSSADAVTYAWDFGDGTTSSEPFAEYQYAEGGTYQVSLTITTANGCENTFEVTLNLDGEGFTGNPVFQLLNDVETTIIDETTVKAYPNPVSDLLNVVISAPAADDYQVQLFGTDGRMYVQQMQSFNAGDQQLQLNTSQIAAGMYILRVQSTTGTTTVKVIKD
jgi:PKD repeat protein